MADAATLRKRLDVVERTMSEVGWSARIVRALAEQFGVEERTVYRYRAQVLEDIAKAYEGGNLVELRSEFLSRVKGYQNEARKAGAWGVLNGLMNIECKVLGLDAPIKHEMSGAVEVKNGTVEELAEFMRQNLPADVAAKVLGNDAAD